MINNVPATFVRQTDNKLLENYSWKKFINIKHTKETDESQTKPVSDESALFKLKYINENDIEIDCKNNENSKSVYKDIFISEKELRLPNPKLSDDGKHEALIVDKNSSKINLTCNDQDYKNITATANAENKLKNTQYILKNINGNKASQQAIQQVVTVNMNPDCEMPSKKNTIHIKVKNKAENIFISKTEADSRIKIFLSENSHLQNNNNKELNSSLIEEKRSEDIFNKNKNLENYKETNKEVLYEAILQNSEKGDKEAFLDNLSRLYRLEGENINIHFHDKASGKNALHLACEEGNLKIVEILIKLNFNLNLKVKNKSSKKTALHISCEKGYFDISKVLIENGADLNKVDFEMNTPFHLCCAQGHIELVQFILNKNLFIYAKNNKGLIAFDLLMAYINKNTDCNLIQKEKIKKMMLDYFRNNNSATNSNYQGDGVHHNRIIKSLNKTLLVDKSTDHGHIVNNSLTLSLKINNLASVSGRKPYIANKTNSTNMNQGHKTNAYDIKNSLANKLVCGLENYLELNKNLSSCESKSNCGSYTNLNSQFFLMKNPSELLTTNNISKKVIICQQKSNIKPNSSIKQVSSFSSNNNFHNSNSYNNNNNNNYLSCGSINKNTSCLNNDLQLNLNYNNNVMINRSNNYYISSDISTNVNSNMNLNFSKREISNISNCNISNYKNKKQKKTNYSTGTQNKYAIRKNTNKNFMRNIFDSNSKNFDESSISNTNVHYQKMRSNNTKRQAVSIEDSFQSSNSNSNIKKYNSHKINSSNNIYSNYYNYNDNSYVSSKQHKACLFENSKNNKTNLSKHSSTELDEVLSISDKKFSNINNKLNADENSQQIKFEKQEYLRNDLISHIIRHSTRTIGISISLNSFYIHLLLGKGSFGEVYLVEYKPTRKLYAMKVLIKEKILGREKCIFYIFKIIKLIMI